MTTKAPSTLLLIIEKQHASWDLMGSASPAVDLVHRAPRATLTVRGRALQMAPVRQPFRVSSPNRLEFRVETKCVAVRARRLTRLRRVSSASDVEWPCRQGYPLISHPMEGRTNVLLCAIHACYPPPSAAAASDARRRRRAAAASAALQRRQAPAAATAASRRRRAPADRPPCFATHRRLLA